MDFGLSEDQRLFQDAVAGWLGEHVPVERVRVVMESDSGSDASLVAGLAAQGITGVLIDEAYGGAGLRLLDMAVIGEQLGAAATPLSYHTACVMAPLAIAAAATEEQKRSLLATAARGEATLSFIVDGPALRDRKLNGSCKFVADAHFADAFVVVATGKRGDSELLLVARDTPGLRSEQLSLVEATRRVGEVVFDDVVVEDSMRMEATDTAALVDRIVDAGRIALAADALGAAQRSLDLAVAYALQRSQFDRLIASFQAVKHMCAETVAEIEPVRSLLWYAAFAWDERYEDAAVVASLLKAYACDVATRATTTAIQVFGGMGFTYECDVHIWFKRAGYDRQMLGGPSELRERAAALQFAR